MRKSPYCDSDYSNPENVRFVFENSIAPTDKVSMETRWTPTETHYILKWNPVAEASAYRVRIVCNDREIFLERPTVTEVDLTKLFAQYGTDATLDCFVKTLSSQEGRLSSEEVLYRAFIAESGEFVGGDGSAENPYLIYTAEQLKAMENGEGKHYLLKSHLTLPENEYLPGGFSGSLKGDVDGQRAVITLHINLPDAVGVGLFAGTGAGTIENICVAGSIIGSNNVGGIAGSGTGTRFINCFNTADITATANKLSNQNDNGCNVAGIVGTLSGTGSSVKDCANFGRIEAKGGRNAGGILGTSAGNPALVIENCENSGDILSPKANVGGIAGFVNSGLTTRCRNYGSVSGGSANVGGILGACYDDLTESYNTGEVKASGSSSGGIAGTFGGKAQNVILNNNYNTGNIVNASNKTAYSGIVGVAGQAGYAKKLQYNYTVGSSANDFAVVPTDTVLEGNYVLQGAAAKVQKATELTGEQMQDLSSFQGFDPAVWTIGVTEGYAYPTLINNPHKAKQVAPVPVLSTPAAVQVTEKDGKYTLTFTGDSRAVKHVIYITGSDPIETTSLSLDISSAFPKTGDYKIGIRSFGDGVHYQNSMTSEILLYQVLKEERLTASSDLTIAEEADRYLLSFVGDVHAVKHRVTVDGYESVFETVDGTVQKVDLTEALTQCREYTIREVSIGDAKQYADSEEASIQYTVVDKTILSAPADVTVTWGGENGA